MLTCECCNDKVQNKDANIVFGLDGRIICKICIAKCDRVRVEEWAPRMTRNSIQLVCKKDGV